MGRSGRLGFRRLRLKRDADDHLLLRWGRETFDLSECVVRHRDNAGRIEFSVTPPGGPSRVTRYERKGPRARDELFDRLDFTADEPWTWEDRDFGLFTFHVATQLGPVKYRHLIEPQRQSPREGWRGEVKIDEVGVSRVPWMSRPEHVQFAEVTAVRAKFELSGIWAEPTLIVLDSLTDLAVVPVSDRKGVERVRAQLLPQLRGLPGWSTENEMAIEDAYDYALREPRGPLGRREIISRAERPIWP